ncbi:ABC transporter transmembrane domain-containing protein [Lactobacillus sp. ESL0791]|uniref:ABC transporter transmembrane domain-containing protein n=1 Tax=Lactobacillus sp. ESL0791 TaxID=2983234 RepID=UPI0023F6A41B|nr:ABC transporter transmembrane domain-containing protein [Lactobacillus sp. ESL0791]MDF7637980.1 ABC transporter transmembrane domain-containing protein [Lactobacillus sp. ESL0791]
MSLFNYFKRTKFQFILVIVLTVINAGWQTLGGISSANALSAVAQMNGKQFFIWVGIMTLAYTFYAVFGNWITVSTAYLTQNIDTLIRTDVAKRLAAADYHYFHEQTTATYTSWLTNDINTINEFGIGDLMMIIQQISEISMSAVTLAYFHYSLLITTAILTIIMAIVPNLFTKLMAKRSLSFTHANERLVNTINDLLDGFNTLFLANAAQVIVNKINDACGDVKKHAVAYKKAAGASAWTTNLISFACQSILPEHPARPSRLADPAASDTGWDNQRRAIFCRNNFR